MKAECPYCDKLFDTFTERASHMIRCKNKNGLGKVHCQRCNKPFSTFEAMASHYPSCNGKKH